MCEGELKAQMLKTKKPAEASFFVFNGWGTRIRTSECWYQKPEPYRLAIPHPCNAYLGMVREARLELAHLAAPEPKSGASTNFATPAKKMVATTGFEPVTPSL